MALEVQQVQLGPQVQFSAHLQPSVHTGQGMATEGGGSARGTGGKCGRQISNQVVAGHGVALSRARGNLARVGGASTSCA